MMGDEVPLEMVARIRMLTALLADLQARLPAARRDIAWLIGDRGEEPVERHEQALFAVEAVLRRRFGEVLDVPADFWRAAAEDALAAAEAGL